jgi:uncharacterized RDD family membrane protein YckC
MYAPYPRRAAAWFIDVFLIFAVFLGVGVSVRYAFLSPHERSDSGQGPEILLIPLMPLYGAVCHCYWHGQTLGKRALGILDSLWPLWQLYNRSLHDLAASTVVVRNIPGD